jgi:type II secretory pathway pseudopilin PulG
MNKINKQEAGFSYIDVMIAMAILMVGVMALVGAITNGINLTTRSALALSAKQVSSSTVESIFTARDLDTFLWPAIGNVGDALVPAGVFLTGKQNIYPTPGKDGIIGTADDSWGADGIQGNADDAAANTPAVGILREIIVTGLVDPDRPTSPITLRQIDVNIYYKQGAIERKETFTSYIASYRDSDTSV